MFVLVPSLRAAVLKRKMHRALFVPEILLIVFKHVTDSAGNPLLPTLAALARTCQTFQRQVEEILWYELPSISPLHNILPPNVRDRGSRSWSLSRRMLSGPGWTRFMDRARRVRVLVENASPSHVEHEQCSAILLAMACLRDPPLLTPNLRKLVWQPSSPSLNSAVNLFIGPSLLSLEIDTKLLVNCIPVPLGDTCPWLEHLKVTGNGRCSANTISSILCGLHFLTTVSCSTLDNEAFFHLSQLKNLTYLAIDTRWSLLNLDVLHDRFLPGSFRSLKTLRWKDYRLESLADIFLVPDISPSTMHLEIESFCTSPSLRTFLLSFTARFPRTQSFSLVHDTVASRRIGLQAGAPGRQHQLDACDLQPVLALRRLRVLKLVDLGDIQVDNDLIKMIASALPELEQLDLGINGTEPMPSSVTFDGLLSLLHHCPKMKSFEVCVDAKDMLSFVDTTVQHDHLTHLRLEGSILGSRRPEVDKMLRRVLPELRTVEECLDGVMWRVRHVWTMGETDDTTWTPPAGGRTTGRRTRNSLESVRGGY